jgi:hypothetical protein
MSWQTVYVLVRTGIVVGGLGTGAGIMWAALAGGLSRWLFGIDEEAALLWVALPIFILFIPFTIFVLPKHLRKAGLIE